MPTIASRKYVKESFLISDLPVSEIVKTISLGTKVIQEHPMTGYTVHTGSSEKFSQGWDQIFQRQKKQAVAKPEAKPAASKKATKNAKKK